MKTKTLCAAQWRHPHSMFYSVGYKGEYNHGEDGRGYTITEAKEYAKRHGYTHIRYEKETGNKRVKV